ncbi:Lrp/AsnC ligand binding domain-containing protein [uncultured Jannaschia sp.]|uniref:Lrp/AsnC ligand binding domain-containing protein n=1 Tax=uncultured Jannaschia sp. TaxID=293347 RepID=UPI00345CAF7B
MSQIDRTDRRIIAALQRDGRMAVTALSEAVGLSANAVAERMRRLQRDGVITGYRAILSPRALGLGLTAFCEIKLDRTSADIFEEFAAAVRDVEAVEECHMVAGGFDYLLKTRHADMDAYRAFLSDALLALPGVRETRTYPVMESVVERGGAVVA